MLKAKLAFVVGNCTRLAWFIIALAAVLSLVSGVYGARHFAIDTDINRLISPDLPWRQQELAFSRAFPQQTGTIFAVLDAPTFELASQASKALAKRLSGQEDLLRAVDEPQNSQLFVRDGLLFLATDELERSLGGLTQAQPLLQTLVTDPNLRGLQQVLSLGRWQRAGRLRERVGAGDICPDPCRSCSSPEGRSCPRHSARDRSASRCLRRCSPLPTRSSNNRAAWVQVG